jgi:ATP-dependent protease ClpP protease subunit
VTQKKATWRVRTRAAVKQDARALLSEPSRAVLAAVEEDETTDTDTDKIGELWLYGVVGGWWSGFNAESVADALRSMDVDQLYVRLHSPGGLASDGIAIGNLLRNHKATVTVVVDGLAASAASVIAVAGDEVVMCPGSQMMLHDASTFGWGNAADLRRIADWIDGQSQNYAGVYQYRAGGTVDHWREVMLANDGDGTWYTAEEAVAAGLADSVGTRTAVGSPPTAPDDEDLDDDETWARATHDLEVLDRHVPPAARAAWRREHPKPPTASADGSITTQEGSPAVAFSDEQVTNMRQKLGVAEDADEATILAALDEALSEQVEPSVSVPEGHVVVPEARLSDLEAAAQRGVDAATKLQTREREEFLDANRTKFAPTNRAAWAREYDRDPEGTRKHFAEAPEIVPTASIGHDGDPVGTTQASEDAEYYSLYPEEKAV